MKSILKNIRQQNNTNNMKSIISLLLILAFLTLCAAFKSPVVHASYTLPPTKIMMIGDSITQGSLAQASYRRQLYFKLKQANYNFQFVGSRVENYPYSESWFKDFDRYHEGYWGWRTDQILTNNGTNPNYFDSLVSTNTPDLVLIHVGTNNVLQAKTMQDYID